MSLQTNNTLELGRGIKVGEWQTIDTLISEEALLFVKYLRNERKDWNPRIPSLRIEVEGKKRKELTINT